MREFTTTAERQLATLPKSTSQPALLAQAATLRSKVEAKAPPPVIAKLARQLGADLLKAYPVLLVPAQLPNLNRGSELFQANCAACHGVAGHGDGPAARGLDRKPVDFTDRARAKERSSFALEQVIDQGINGTAMQSFASLPAQDRWDLAFKVGTFAYPPSLAAEGQRIWENDPSLRSRMPNLAALATMTPAGLGQQIGQGKATAVIACLRSNPAAIQPSSGDSLAITRSRLAASVRAYAAGNKEEARNPALSAYLDGFEPIEPILTARNPDLMQDSPGALLAGVCAGAALLAAIAWAMLRYSAKLPVAEFFRYSSILMAALAAILAGKGIAAIQEAGLLGVTPVDWIPRIDWVGLQPSLQVVLAQLAVLVALILGFHLNSPRRTIRADH